VGGPNVLEVLLVEVELGAGIEVLRFLRFLRIHKVLEGRLSKVLLDSVVSELSRGELFLALVESLASKVRQIAHRLDLLFRIGQAPIQAWQQLNLLQLLLDPLILSTHAFLRIQLWKLDGGFLPRLQIAHH